MRIRSTAVRMRYLNIPLCVVMLLSGSSLLAQDTFDFDAFMANAEVLFFEGDYEGAIADLERAASRSDLSDLQQAKLYELLTFCHHSLDDTDGSKASLMSLFRAKPDYALRQEWLDEDLLTRADEARQAVEAELLLKAESDAEAKAQDEPTVATKPKPAVSDGTEMQAEVEPKKGGSKRVYYIAGGAVALVGLLLLAGGDKKENDGISTVDTLPFPPARPTGP